MSNTPLPQWTHSLSDSLDTSTRAGDDAGRGIAAIPNPVYSTQEPPRFLFPDSQGYDPTASTSSHSRFVFEGAKRDSAEHRYSVSSSTSGPLAPYAWQRSSISKNVDYGGPSSSYYEASSQGRGSIGSTGRANDIESL